MKRFVCIHGHFYQPPRENPWLETIEVQDSAYPYHDWNQRIAAECYAPNAACRILDEDDHIIRIVNNYAQISFNFGPTLLAWLQTEWPDVYAAILEADQTSRERFSGHGSALAQAYNHAILPLANARHKELQVVWGLEDFRHRFGRTAEGFWLPETAVDLKTLELLAQHGIKFTILSPYQARRVRPLDPGTSPQSNSEAPDGTSEPIARSEWEDASGGALDHRRPYLLKLPSGSQIAIFFYDGPTSRAVAFEHLLNNGESFARRLNAEFSADSSEPQLVHLATDGETYGHHHRFGDMALAFALDYLESNGLAQLTNYGEYLDRFPPAWEVEIIENSSWSCIHGIERWRSDCGCNSGSRPDWNQHWRAPLRRSLEWLDQQLEVAFQDQARSWLKHPRKAQLAYINVVLSRSEATLDAFLEAHGARPLNSEERTQVIKLLEMQRFAALMFTSCAWFFDEISGIETVQVLQYAARAAQLAQEVCGIELETKFMESLAEAPSNVLEFQNGRRVYQQLVQPVKVDLLKVGAHFALSSLFEDYGESNPVFCYRVDSVESQAFQTGAARATAGKARVTSLITRESQLFTFAAVHLGDHNVNGGVRPFQSEERLLELSEALERCILRVDLPGTVRLLDLHFQDHLYSLDSLFRDEQRKILNIILDGAVGDLEASIESLYRQKIPLMLYLESLNLPLPRVMALTTQFVMEKRLRELLRTSDFDLEDLERLLNEAEARRVTWEDGAVHYDLELRIEAMTRRALESPHDVAPLEKLVSTLELLRRIPFTIDLWKAQNLYWNALKNGVYRQANPTWRARFQELGSKLRVRIPETASQ